MRWQTKGKVTKSMSDRAARVNSPWWIEVLYNLGNVRLRSNEVAESGHCTWTIQHAIIHVNIQHLGSHFHLHFGNAQCFLRKEFKRKQYQERVTQEKADKSSPSPSRAVPSNSTRLPSQPFTLPPPDPELLSTITDEPFLNISSITVHHSSEPTEALIPPVKNLSPSAWCSRSWGPAPSSYPTQHLPPNPDTLHPAKSAPTSVSHILFPLFQI